MNNIFTDFWPATTAGAVSLSFDDGLDSHLDNALPLLDRANIKGTFYVNPVKSPKWEAQLLQWQTASQNGHEIGNHTTQHPCSCNFGFDSNYCLEKLSLEHIVATIDAAEEELNKQFPEADNHRSFCYPCYQSYVGTGIKRESYVPVIAERFSVGRGGGERANNPALIDLAYTWAWAVEDHNAKQLIAYIEKAIVQGYWAIICMHGIGADHLAISTEALAETVDYLSIQRHRIWTDTVVQIGDYIHQKRQ